MEAVKVQEDIITISKSHYDALVDKRDFLNALLAAGVDNWEGYSEACQIYNEE